jgi:hypothetical protein
LINLIEINEYASSRDRFDRARNGLVEAESERRIPRPPVHARQSVRSWPPLGADRMPRGIEERVDLPARQNDQDPE